MFDWEKHWEDMRRFYLAQRFWNLVAGAVWAYEEQLKFSHIGKQHSKRLKPAPPKRHRTYNWH